MRITTVPMSLKILLKGQLRYMREHGFKVVAVSADGQEVGDLKTSEGVEHEVVPFTRAISPITDLRCLIRLIKIIRRTKPDIVHTHTPKAGLLGMMAAYFCSVPVRMHTVAGLPLMEARGFKRRLLINVERVTYRCAHWVYPNSQGLMDYITRHISSNRSKFRMLGKGSSNGINVEFFSRSADIERLRHELRAKLGFKENDIVYSFVGRIVKDKGIAELALAFKKILDETEVARARQERPEIFLLLVGAFEHDLSPLSGEILDFLEHNKNVRLTGFQQDVRGWLAASDVFVFPSYREGFPNVVMQAAVLRVPIIASDINGCNEMIHHNESGLIVPPKDIDALYKAMSSLAFDKQKQEMFAENAYRYIVQNFEQRTVWSELMKEYERLLNSTR